MAFVISNARARTREDLPAADHAQPEVPYAHRLDGAPRAMPYTCDCGLAFDLKAALDAIPTGRMGKGGMLFPTCARCGQSVEVRLRDGGYDVGFSYFGGSLHFEPLQRVSVRGLRVTPSEPDDLEVVLGARRWQFQFRR